MYNDRFAKARRFFCVWNRPHSLTMSIDCLQFFLYLVLKSSAMKRGAKRTKKIKVIIERSIDSYWSYAENVEGINGVGDTVDDAKQSAP